MTVLSKCSATAVLLCLLIPGAVRAGNGGKSTPGFRNNLFTTGGRGVQTTDGKINFGDINGRLRRLEEDIEEAEEKLSRSKPNSRNRIYLQTLREKLALEMVQSAQIYFYENGTSRNDGRTRKLYLLLQNESKVLQPTLKKIKEFPFPDRLTEISQVMLDIRAGRARFDGKVPRSNSALLKAIHEKQSDLLKEYHKEVRRNRGKDKSKSKK